MDEKRVAWNSPSAVARLLITAGIGLGLDLWAKWAAVTRLEGAGVVDFIPGWIRFEYTSNRGAVFGIAQGQRLIFLVVSGAAIVFLLYLFAASAGRWFYQIILGMLLAGVMGNMYDRVRYGYVRDMIHALPGWYWPDWMARTAGVLPREVFPWIFNVADTLLCVGVTLMLIYSALHPHMGKDARPVGPA